MNESRIISKNLIAIISLACFCIVISVLFVNNVRLKAQLTNLRSPIVHDYALQNAHLSQERNSSESVVITGEPGVWDRDRKVKVEFIHELTIGEQEGSDETIFHLAGPVKSDTRGNIYVAESWTQKICTIKKFDSKGNYLLTIGSKGKGPGEFLGVFNFEFEQDIIIVVFDPGTARMTRFTSNGQYLNSIQLQLQNMQLPEAFYGCAIDQEGFYYLSFYDYNSDKVVHKFNSKGEHLRSFGDPFKLKTPYSGFVALSLKTDIAPGKLAFFNEDLFFSQNNPYEIRKYNIAGDLNMIILRKNTFMPPAKVDIKGNNTYKFWIPAQSTGLTVWQNFLINYIWVPSHINKKIGTIIDIFTLNGQLLSTIALKEEILFTHVDQQGKLYGVQRSEDFGERIVRYALKFKKQN